MALPFVSVVVPALNCADDVQGFIEAMGAQTYPRERLELVMADNGSTDGTPDRLMAAGVRCVIRPDRGRSRALNAGLRAARGDIVCTTDMSCRPSATWVERVARCFEDRSVGCVAGEIVMLPTGSNLALRFQARTNYMSPMYAAGRRTLPFLPFADGANASFRRSVFEEIGPFDESFFKGADVEICYRMLVSTSYKIAFCREAVVAEPGEPTLGALLKQRFRIAMGVSLMEAKYPQFYKPVRGANALKRAYWQAAVAARNLRSLRRSTLEDALVRTLMSWAQLFGRHYGRRYLRRQTPQPTRMDDRTLCEFISRMTVLDERVLIR